MLENFNLPFEFEEGQTDVHEEFTHEGVDYFLEGTIFLKSHFAGESDGEIIYDDTHFWEQLALYRVLPSDDLELISDDPAVVEEMVYNRIYTSK